MIKSIQLVTTFGLLVMCLQSLGSRSHANEYRVVATRYSETGRNITYRLIRDTQSGDPTCFWIYDTHDETTIYSVKPVSQDIIFKNGGWHVILESMKSRNSVWDENADGLFDALFDPTGKIRFGNDLIEIYDSKRAPWKFAEEIATQTNGRHFVFNGNQWHVQTLESEQDQLSNTPLAPSVYTVPRNRFTKDLPQVDTEALIQKLSTLEWRKPDFFVWSECEYVPIASEITRLDSGKTEIRFHTMKNVLVRVILSSSGVARWEFGNVFSQEFFQAGPDGVFRSKFTAGPFEYSDRDGDGRMDEFYNSDAEERIEIREDSLAPARSTGFFIWTFLAVSLGFVALAFVIRFLVKRFAPKTAPFVGQSKATESRHFHSESRLGSGSLN